MDKVLFDELLHRYYTESGKVFKSVTEILKKHSLAGQFDNVPQAVLARAAMRGTLIHKEIELLIKSLGKDLGLSDQCQWFADNIYNLFTEWQSEVMVWDDAPGVMLAGTIDLICRQSNGRLAIIDIKTGKVHMDWVSWQLSLYRYLYCRMNGIDPDDIDLYVLDLKETGSKLIPVMFPIPLEEIINLLECERDGFPFMPKFDVVTEKKYSQLMAFEETIRALKLQIAEAEKGYAEMKDEIYQSMCERGIKTIETPRLKLTRVDPSTTKRLDSKKLEKDLPEIYAQYVKESKTSGYLKITEVANEVRPADNGKPVQRVLA